ncbi:Gti1/Pac2 family-domain-containing protein [Mycena belliarum]|uniref:Gti1/Pac2 family-domain-containing protein n=1 Tax=Mycena belliarum TaxID=1033014 RepID=A0AAD6UHW3_9AGAR|nr:Gti1/Pac2 family-domain-containing protein [Mycena belliae]
MKDGPPIWRNSQSSSSTYTARSIMSCVTHSALHIRDITDAHRVFEAVRLGTLPLIKRRLLPHERAELQSGNTFVWEESESEDGLVRWTEGRRWSQSRMRGDCLYYEEKVETSYEEKQAKAIRRAIKASESSGPVPAPPKRKDRPSKIGGLTKQTYSVTVQMPDAVVPRRWHLVAYFSASDVPILPVLDDYSYLKNIRVPPGVFLTTSRVPGGSPEPCMQSLDNPGTTTPSTQGSLSPRLECGELNPLGTAQPFPQEIRINLPPISSAQLPIKLPSLSSLGYPSPRAPTNQRLFPSASRVVARQHKAIRSDDRRILDRFRIDI